jgi:hypothetical protein
MTGKPALRTLTCQIDGAIHIITWIKGVQ